MSRLVFTFLLLYSTFGLSGQIGHGGSPLMLEGPGHFGAGYDKKGELVKMPSPPASVLSSPQLVKEEAQPLRFAHPNFVELTPENSGKMTVLDDGRLLWRLRLSSPGAYSLNVIFDKFHLAKGDSLFLYDPEGRVVIGALTHENNKSWGGLATAPVPGDELIVEWRGRNSGRQGSQLMIGAVNHDYLDVFRYLTLKAGDFGDSGNCHPDLSCKEDEGIQQNGQSVCRIIMEGTELCSGNLMNNTRNDGVPYFLTAAHCLKEDLATETAVFLFNYQVPACQEDIEGASVQSISGSEIKAFADELDFALLEMSSNPPLHYRPYYAGWDLTSSPGAGVFSVHHPQGDVKKIAVSDDAPAEATFNASSVFDNSFESNSHWKVAEWNEGTTEAGSSGAGLFMDNNKALIGFLSGGSANCSNPVNDYFGRLNKIWDFNAEDSARVDIWLDPVDDGEATSVEGYDPNDGNMLRLSHFPDNGTPAIQYLNNVGGGFWTGPNEEGTLAVAERFGELASGDLYGIYLMPGKDYVDDDGTIDVKIWSGIDAPATLLAEKKGVVINGSRNRELLVMFDEPVSVSGPFFAGYEIDQTEPVDSFGVYQMGLTEQENSFYIKKPDNHWTEYPLISDSGPAALWIDVLVGEAVMTDSTVTDSPVHDFLISPNPATGYVNLFYPEDGNGVVTLYDLSGKIHLKKNLVVYNNMARLEFPGKLFPGVYLLQLEIRGQTVVKKLIIEKKR
ncbi:MAG: T9SS type A sorting domain-containing protein [Marinilabiliaceae bacterium]